MATKRHIKTVIAQTSGQVFTSPQKLRIWGDASVHYQQHQRAVRVEHVARQPWLSLDEFDQAARERANQRGIDKYATVPHDMALVVRPEWEFFKAEALPDTWL